jgi:hypothetical protein
VACNGLPSLTIPSCYTHLPTPASPPESVFELTDEPHDNAPASINHLPSLISRPVSGRWGFGQSISLEPIRETRLTRFHPLSDQTALREPFPAWLHRRRPLVQHHRLRNDVFREAGPSAGVFRLSGRDRCCLNALLAACPDLPSQRGRLDFKLIPSHHFPAPVSRVVLSLKSPAATYSTTQRTGHRTSPCT